LFFNVRRNTAEACGDEHELRAQCQTMEHARHDGSRVGDGDCKNTQEFYMMNSTFGLTFSKLLRKILGRFLILGK